MPQFGCCQSSGFVGLQHKQKMFIRGASGKRLTRNNGVALQEQEEKEEVFTMTARLWLNLHFGHLG